MGYKQIQSPIILPHPFLASQNNEYGSLLFFDCRVTQTNIKVRELKPKNPSFQPLEARVKIEGKIGDVAVDLSKVILYQMIPNDSYQKTLSSSPDWFRLWTQQLFSARHDIPYPGDIIVVCRFDEDDGDAKSYDPFLVRQKEQGWQKFVKKSGSHYDIDISNLQTELKRYN